LKKLENGDPPERYGRGGKRSLDFFSNTQVLVIRMKKNREGKRAPPFFQREVDSLIEMKGRRRVLFIKTGIPHLISYKFSPKIFDESKF